MPELKAKFTADDSQFSAKVDGLKGKVGMLRSAFGAMAGGFSLAAVGQFIKSSIAMASEIKDASDAIGVSTDELQAFRQEAERAGSSAEKMEQAMNKIAQARNEAISDPTGTSAKIFEKLGLSAMQLENMDLAATVVAVGQAMNAAGKDAEVMAAAVDLIGVRSKRMVEAVKAIGAAGTQGSIDKLANPFDVDAIESLDQFADNLKEVGTAYKAQVANLLALGGLAPKTFVAEGKAAEERSARFRKLRAEQEAFDRKMTTGEDTAPEQSMVQRRLAEAARKINDKTLSAFSNISDPVAAIGRGAGKDFSYDAAMSLREIAANTRRIQPTPAPTMR
jgi:hypothetical protein